MSQFFKFYQAKLQTHPFITNALTTGFLFGTGDILAQCLFPTRNSSPLETSSSSSLRFKISYDYKRTLRAVVYGSCIFALIGDKWYKFLSSNVQLPTGTSPLLTSLAKMAVDQLMFAPLGIPVYYTAMTLLEGYGLEDVRLKLKQNWWDTVKANWCVWPFVQFVNFQFVPVSLNLLVVNAVSILWNTFLSYKNSQADEIIEEVQHLEKIA
ncbi:hypothetical protein WICPIJ_008096 [Wickerhamomyces pijperi]|uniref:Protein SYM1 n=1 Tax=Wickerhamomyces pijperi TaxID=599730 RepID=A0A9P8TJQ5_WICPI|nr:hypothetical protein WICPIJ_008096 [Wickerhamomyces pijperi]